MPKKLRKGQIEYTSRINFIMGIFKRIKKNLMLNNDEIFFLKNYKTQNINRVNKKIILVQIHPDHYFFSHFALILKNKKFRNYQFIGIWTNIVFYKNSRISFLKFLFDSIYNLFLKYKWLKFYRKIGIYKVYDMNNNFKSNLIPSKNSFINNNMKNISKTSINSISYKNINIGNCIYDTYLRFYNKVTFSHKDNKVLKKILTYVYFSFKNLNSIYRIHKTNIHYYLTSDHTYIQNGIPITFFKNKGVKVIGGTRTTSYLLNYNKSINGLDFESYSKIFKNFKNKKNKIKIAKKFIYSSSSNFLSRKLEKKSKSKIINNDLDVIIFLPDFVDAPHGKGWLIFNDFSEWIEQTLDFLTKKNINIGVKPHPMSRYASLVYEEKLKEKYMGKIKWLRNVRNNLNLYKKNFLFAITPSGSVTYGLGLNNKITINCGRNPYMSFSYAITPKSKKEYFKVLEKGLRKKLKNVKISKDTVLASIFMFFIHKTDFFETLSRKIDLFQYLNFEKPSRILRQITTNKTVLNEK